MTDLIKCCKLSLAFGETKLLHFHGRLRLAQYSCESGRSVIEELDSPKPIFRLNCSTGSHAQQTSSLLLAIERYLEEAKPDLVIVQGDTNAALAGALAATKLNIPVAPIEAGCRSFDMKMSEEMNRPVVDAISSLLFAPTQKAVQNLLREGVGKDTMEMVGRTLGEVCRRYYANALRKAMILSKLGLEPKGYALLTTHRQENVDVKENLPNIVSAFSLIDTTVVFPIQPRTVKRLDEFGLQPTLHRVSNVILSERLGYFDFFSLLSRAQIVMTDCGGIQEESTIFPISCTTLLEATPSWENVEQGANILVGARSDRIVDTVNRVLDNEEIYGQMSHAEVFP